MLRTQIQITEKQASRLKALAARRGVSMAELVRQDEIYRRALQAAGRVRSGTRDGSIRHDAYLAEEYAE
jgi:hypothetical protein